MLIPWASDDIQQTHLSLACLLLLANGIDLVASTDGCARLLRMGHCRPSDNGQRLIHAPTQELQTILLPGLSPWSRFIIPHPKVQHF